MTSPLPPGAERPAARERLAAAGWSLVLHAAAGAGLVLLVGAPRSHDARPFLALVPEGPAREVVLPPLEEAPLRTTAPAVPSPSPRASALSGAPDGAPGGAPDSVRPGDAAAADSPAARAGPLGPRYGEGIVWVSPLPRSPRQVAEAMAGRSVADLADAEVERLVRAFLDSLAREPGAAGATLPSWTTQIGGREYGIDGQAITVAGIRIPAALLALIPLPVQGNYDQDRAWREAMAIRQDIFDAARRADNLDEFKRHVRALREETERRREFERNRRTTPPADPPGDPALP